MAFGSTAVIRIQTATAAIEDIAAIVASAVIVGFAAIAAIAAVHVAGIGIRHGRIIIAHAVASSSGRFGTVRE